MERNTRQQQPAWKIQPRGIGPIVDIWVKANKGTKSVIGIAIRGALLMSVIVHGLGNSDGGACFEK